MLNRHEIIGNLGDDPIIKTMQSGDKVANFSVATSESYKKDGERKTITQWHRVVCFNQPLITVIEQYLKKGSKVLIEGQIEHRSWEQDGQKKYTTETVMRPFKSNLLMLDSRSSTEEHSNSNGGVAGSNSAANAVDELEDEIPF